MGLFEADKDYEQSITKIKNKNYSLEMMVDALLIA